VSFTDSSSAGETAGNLPEFHNQIQKYSWGYQRFQQQDNAATTSDCRSGEETKIRALLE